ncbi:MAG: DUF6261 family protein, partial [Dysgonamonadaceae bacterium]|nr:DUF6261 family protein [Dysgonamonadaceae bacterium]
SDLTGKIFDASRRQCRALIAIRKLVSAQKFSATEAIADAAVKVYTMLMESGNISRKPYEDQAGYIESVIRLVSSGGEYYEDVQTVSEDAPSINERIAELVASNELFKNLLEERDAQSILKPGLTFKQIRREIEPIYRKIAAIVNANAGADTSPAFSALINLLNPEIDRLNMENRRVRYSVARCRVEEIPSSPATGLPITPTPEVFYISWKKNAETGSVEETTTLLELGKDYNLAFKDNLEPGNAQCIIRGKGGYKNKKTVSFSITDAL